MNPYAGHALIFGHCNEDQNHRRVFGEIGVSAHQPQHLRIAPVANADAASAPLDDADAQDQKP